MRGPFKATNVVLSLLCVMYFITYVDRVNVNSAAGAFQDELGLNNTQLGLIFSAFAYPYLVFQVIGGWVGDKFGARRVLFVCGLIWAGATILTGLAWSFTSLFVMRLLLGFGEGATFPTATRVMRSWVEPRKYGFAQGITHSFARLGNAVTPPIVAALILATSWRWSFVIIGVISLIWVTAWYWYFRDEPSEHPTITPAEIAVLPPSRAGKAAPEVPWGPLIRRMWPVTLTYFCYGWSLWLYVNWIPLFFQRNYDMDIKNTALYSLVVFAAGFVGDTVGGVLSDKILHATGNIRFARISVTVLGFVGALISLIPMLYFHDATIITLSLATSFFFAEVVIGPMWAVPMDIAPKYSGTASGLMNTGSAFAAIVSPLVTGYIIDTTGNWELPFFVLMGFFTVGGLTAFLMHPEQPFEDVPAERTASA